MIGIKKKTMDLLDFLSVISKILEHFLYDEIDKNISNIILRHQGGYRTVYSS